MFLKPKGKKVIVLREQLSEFFNKELGIVAAGRSTEEKPQRGTVIAVGPDVKSTSIGEIVLFARWAGSTGPEPFAGYEPIIMHEDEIDCAFSPEEFDAMVAAEKQRLADAEKARLQAEADSAARLAEARKLVVVSNAS